VTDPDLYLQINTRQSVFYKKMNQPDRLGHQKKGIPSRLVLVNASTKII
jgi:hypothetical protein